MNSQLTIHIINELPWSNLNRDDSGLPKRTRQGGKQRGLLSSQAIKRGARANYESSSLDLSYRSANLAEMVASRAQELNPELDQKDALKFAKKLVGTLTKAEKNATKEEKTDTKGSADSGKKEAGRSAWLSAEEIETAAHIVAEGADEGDFVGKGKSGSLAIAAFGRMFAARPELQTEAAISVSPAVSTHETMIETDYFSTGDDKPTESQGKGATYLGIAHYINGVFYRSVTIDRDQLKRSWTGISGENASKQLEQMVTALIYGMPRGKEKSTAPYTAPALILIETQAYRVAYDFETPVVPEKDGGYLASTIDRLREEREAAYRFDPDNFGTPSAIAGTAKNLSQFGVEEVNRAELAQKVASWILQ